MSGKLVRYKKGEVCFTDLSHISHAEAVVKQKTAVVESSDVRVIHPKPLDGTVKQIKAWLDANGIKYDATARKPELIELLKNA